MQRCENESLRKHCGMGAKHSGVMLKRLHPTCSLRDSLQRAAETEAGQHGERLRRATVALVWRERCKGTTVPR